MSESFPRERATATSDADGDLLNDLYAQEKSAMSISQGGVRATHSAARLGSTSSSSIASAVAERPSLRNFELPSLTSRSALNSASVSGQVISSSSPAKASISSTEWTCHLVPGVKSYPREIFLAVDQYKPAKPDAVPASTVRYTTEDALTFSNPDSIREAKCMIEAQLRQSFPEPKYEFKIFLKRPPLCTGSWTMDITTNDYELLPHMAKEVFVVNFEGEVVFRVKDVGPAHPLNVTMISIFLPRDIQPIDAWKAAKEDMEEHIARYEGSHGCYYQVLAGFSSTSANYYTHLGFETHVMQIQIKVPSDNTGRPLTEAKRAFEETEPPIAAFERVQGWITIRGTSCRTKMMHRFEFCKEHKNNWCGETMQDGSGRVVNDKIHTLKECVCTICGALGHSRFSCSKRPPRPVPIFCDVDFERSKESRDRLDALAAKAVAAAEAEDKAEAERKEKQRSKKRAEPCSPLRPNLFEGVPCSEEQDKGLMGSIAEAVAEMDGIDERAVEGTEQGSHKRVKV